MYVACPSCKNLYRINAAQLRAAVGQVCCGACRTAFSARLAVFDDPQQALAYEHPVPQDDAHEIDDLVNRALDGVPGQEQDAAETPSDAPAADIQESNEPELEPEIEEILVEAVPGTVPDNAGTSPTVLADIDFHAWPATAEYTPQRVDGAVSEHHAAAFLLQEDTATRGTAWGAIAAALLLTLVLIGQFVWVDRYRLVQSAQWRPALEMFCEPLSCDLPLRRDPGQVEIVEREIVRHPYVKDALLVNTTFVNRADFMQAWPVFQISFSDVSGTPVAMRRFMPAEYLPASQANTAGIAPGEQAHLLLEVIDPGKRAVSFQFDFL